MYPWMENSLISRDPEASLEAISLLLSSFQRINKLQEYNFQLLSEYKLLFIMLASLLQVSKQSNQLLLN